MPNLSRRHFLYATAALAATSLSSRRVLGANDRIRVGIIGCRNRGHQDALSMAKSGLFEIATLCDCDTAMIDRAMAELEGHLPATPKFEQDFRRVLDDPGIDAVVNATPDHWHAALTNLALAAGKHVFVEKPASYNLGDGKQMVAAQARHPNLSVAVGTQQRSGAHFHEARAFLREGGLGKVAFARAWIVQDRGRIPAVPDGPPPGTLDYEMWVGPAPFRPYNENRCHYEWHWAREYGTGEMGNWGAHWLDVARWFLDVTYPTAVSGAGGMFVLKDIKEWPDTQTVLYDFPGVTLLWEQRIWSEASVNQMGGGCEFQGEKGSMYINRGGWTFAPREGRAVKHPGSELDVAHVTNFAQAIQGKVGLAAPIVEGHRSAALCHLGNLSVIHSARLEWDAESERITNHAAAAAESERIWRAPWQDVQMKS